MSRNASAASAASPWQGQPFLAADIGGTHARLALVRRGGDGDIELLAHHKYLGGEWPSLEAIIADFLQARDVRVDDLAIASTGVLRGDEVVSNNLPWPVALSRLRGCGIARVGVVNDFTAVAHASQCLRPQASSWLGGGQAEPGPGPTLVVGPGTGFGTALRIEHPGGVLVLPSEAGQIAWAPRTPREDTVLAWMRGEGRHVSVEQVVSGPGLLRTHAALCALDGVANDINAPEAVVAAARGGHAQAGEAVQLFCAVFGGLLGDLAVATLCSRIYVAGGVAGKLRDLIPGSGFDARFLDKGVMREVLAQVPIRLIEDPHKGVVGAASWYLAQGG